ncbi:MAG: hypothetical protein BWY12_02455 [candidate division BRC1 bacterium ADurb.Bin183]|nr:MAG: hypothetical protein BWY12_02455 [candidate division BRC1 bacterium ADurb.Bin183]
MRLISIGRFIGSHADLAIGAWPLIAVNIHPRGILYKTRINTWRTILQTQIPSRRISCCVYKKGINTKIPVTIIAFSETAIFHRSYTPNISKRVFPGDTVGHRTVKVINPAAVICVVSIYGAVCHCAGVINSATVT